MITIECPNCRQALSVPDDALGGQVGCPACQAMILLQFEPAGGGVYDQPTLAGPAAPPAFAPPVAAPPPAYPAPAVGGPPPLPRHPAPGLHPGLAVFSLFSLAVLAGCSVAIAVLLRPAADAGVVLSPGAVGRYAGLEIGSKSVKAVVVEFHHYNSPGDYEFDFLYKATRDTKIGVVDATRKEFDPAALDETAAALRQFADQAAKYQVPPGRVLVACGSGVLQPFAGDPPAEARARRALADAVRKAVGAEVEFVTPAAEAEYDATAGIPSGDRLTAVVIDIGGNNTKGWYFTQTGGEPFEVPVGTKTFRDDVAKVRGKPFGAAARELKGARLNAPFRKAVADKPPVGDLPKAHLIGGAAWAASVLTRPDLMDDPRPPVTADDIARFDALVADRKWDAIQPAAMRQRPVAPGPARDRAEQEITEVRKRFGREDDLVAAAKILLALSEECHFDRKQVKFFRDGLYAWDLGYVFKKSGVEK